MSSADAGLVPHWQLYRTKAEEAHAGRADEHGHGREEQLDEILRVIEAGEPVTPALLKRLDYLPVNRAKKLLRLHGSRGVARSVEWHPDTRPAERAEAVTVVRALLSAAEWDVEWRLANGETFEAVAKQVGLTLPALKMRASRWRARVRHHLGPDW